MTSSHSAFGFNGKAYAQRQSFAELGVEQFDPAVTIVDEPLGRPGHPAPGLPFDSEGTPRRYLVMVRDGTTLAVGAMMLGTGMALQAAPIRRLPSR